MRAPDQSFADAIDAFLQRHDSRALPKEASFLRACANVRHLPRARPPTTMWSLVGSL